MFRDGYGNRQHSAPLELTGLRNEMSIYISSLRDFPDSSISSWRDFPDSSKSKR